MAKIQCRAEVIRAEELQRGIYSMWLHVPEISEQAVPGQFVSLYCNDRDKLLPRPISLCEIDRGRGDIRLVYRVAGVGTKEFSGMRAGDEICVLGPLGNGFPLGDAAIQISDSSSVPGDGERGSAVRPVLVGGGIGIPPLLELAKELEGEVTAVIGFRSADTFLVEEFQRVADRVAIATEDGSLGTEGNVIDAIREQNIQGDVIYSCGPVPMLRGVKEWALSAGIPAWISMEERMACGVGACLGCVCRSAETDSHSNVNNKRICKDGPVFLSTDIELQEN